MEVARGERALQNKHLRTEHSCQPTQHRRDPNSDTDVMAAEAGAPRAPAPPPPRSPPAPHRAGWPPAPAEPLRARWMPPSHSPRRCCPTVVPPLAVPPPPLARRSAQWWPAAAPRSPPPPPLPHSCLLPRCMPAARLQRWTSVFVGEAIFLVNSAQRFPHPQQCCQRLAPAAASCLSVAASARDLMPALALRAGNGGCLGRGTACEQAADTGGGGATARQDPDPTGLAVAWL